MKLKTYNQQCNNNKKNKNISPGTSSRRELLFSIGAVSGNLLLSNVDENDEIVNDSIEFLKTDIDVLVAGGGTAGIIAAIQAARAGVKTAIIEKSGQPGGTMTNCDVNFPGLFHAWGKQIISGIGWNLVKKTVELNNDTLPDFSIPYGNQHWRHQISINSALYAAIAEEACLEAGVELLYYEMPSSTKQVKNKWKLTIIGKGIRRTLTCRQLIDCTGGADIVGMTGLPRLREKEIQPGTLRFKLGGYDTEKLDGTLIDKKYKNALQTGLLQKGDYSSSGGSFIHFLESGGENAQHVFNADSSTAVTQKTANIEGRKSVLRLLRFVRSLPGCENTHLIKMAQETGVRETYRIAGETQISSADYVTGRKFEDAVCYSFYPIDVHDEKGVLPKQLNKGIVPTIPLRALIPQNSRNLIVAGRSVSSDRLANSALRVQASCMAMGQAAGAASALAVILNTTPGKVPLDKLKNLLKGHGAIVPV